MIEIGLSFLEGVALILSPCILPVLPLVLGSSITGGKRRPFGIILGFILAFTAFTLLSRHLVLWLGLDLDLIKYGSLLLLALFGLVLLSEPLSTKFSLWTSGWASVGVHLSAQAQDGFLSGLFIGMLIGLIWTPCAGPILAAVLVQVIRQDSELEALWLLIAFSFGAGLPMLVLSLTGRKLMTKLPFLTSHAPMIRKIFGILILISVAFIAAGTPALSLISSQQDSSPKQSADLQNALDHPYPAPEFTGIEAWLNSNPLTMAELRGKVVLIDFWTYSCINCIRTLPYITRWDRTYRDKGLVIIGVHAPEFEFEKSQANVKNALVTYQIKYPVALDNRLDTWTAFHNRYWPAHYLIDQQGRVVYTHFGEGHYAETENNIRALLHLDQTTERRLDPSASSRGQSPETYLGYARTTHFVSPEGMHRNVAYLYTLAKFIPAHHWALSGPWHIEAEHITAEQAGASLVYNFIAGKVFLVLGSKEGTPIKVSLKLNGEPLGQATGQDAPHGLLTVQQHKLYELVNQDEVKNGLLEITSEAPGLEAYAFTFGNASAEP